MRRKSEIRNDFTSGYSIDFPGFLEISKTTHRLSDLLIQNTKIIIIKLIG